MGWACTKAMKRYRNGMMIQMGAYVAAVAFSALQVRSSHPRGAWLVFYAALPSVAILGMLAVMARYLRDETDEYQRNIVVKSLLWGTAVVLAVSAFVSFLRSWGWPHELPPFAEFALFFLTMGAASGVYRFSDRVSGDE